MWMTPIARQNSLPEIAEPSLTLQPVHGCNLALTALIRAPDDGYLIVFADWQRLDLFQPLSVLYSVSYRIACDRSSKRRGGRL